ncbi:substrate-binding domain-containing protein [Actinoplanes sp. TRM 88003]|uniref:Substrate-binding domain-containing protein n=1 Tax=Paractinoplanes aksuensis TaxID=2939490 RepID=A0ABT1DJV1_9ACTN|nr:substrate-binding domain-containing protein [Actinoplanes aksuensis]MCO8271102.1 substrate-binding domain-containing protein [Actinoplanes aksuensis]
MPGRHRPLQRTGLIVTAAAVAVVVVAGGAWAGYQQWSDSGCAATVQLDVAAAPEIAPAVRSAAEAWSRAEGTCARVTVNAADPAGVAAAVGGEHGVNLAGVGTGARSDASGIDAWIPDSGTWLVRISSEAPGFRPAVLGSIALSPAVLAVPEASAAALSGPARTPKMADLVKKLDSFKPGLVEPSRDATGLAGLLTMAGATDSAALRVGVMRALAAHSSTLRKDLLLKVGDSVGLALLSEADVIAHNARTPGNRLAALYPSPATAALDYPFAIMPGVDPEKAAAATKLRGALGGITAGLAQAGLRGPDGTTGPGFPAPQAAPARIAPPPAPAAAALTPLLGSWTAITQPGRMLAVFDVSGSMKAKVPTAGGLTRAEVTQRTAQQGLALLDGRWSVGNWTFSTNMVGTRPWKENVPISSVATSLPELRAGISRITPKDDGDTGLFDTALAAYAAVKKGWKPGVSNSVVIYTDGANDNPGGLKIEELVARMTELRDPAKPVRMIIIGMGTAIDRNELNAIVKAAGSGGVFVATDPAKIGEIFLEAIASRRGA